MDKVLKRRPKDGIFVFHQEGTPYGDVKTGFLNTVRRAEIGHCRVHDLRHTFATRLVLANVSLPVVKELLRHASIETTMRYAHLTPESKIRAVEMLGWKDTDSRGHSLDTQSICAESQYSQLVQNK